MQRFFRESAQDVVAPPEMWDSSRFTIMQGDEEVYVDWVNQHGDVTLSIKDFTIKLIGNETYEEVRRIAEEQPW